MMNLRKILFALTTLLAITALNAHAAWPTADMVQESADRAQQVIVADGENDEEEIPEEIIQNTMNALTEAMLVIGQHQAEEALTENDKQVIELLDVTIPGILNKIQESSEEIAEELEPKVMDLAVLLLKIQTTYNSEQTSLDAASVISLVMATNYAILNNSLKEEVTSIIIQEMTAE